MKTTVALTAGLTSLALFLGCAIDDRELFEADENGNPIGASTGDGDGDGDEGSGGTGSGGTTPVGNPAECGVGPSWINDGIGYFSNTTGVEMRGRVWGQASGDESLITPDSFQNSPACVTGHFGLDQKWAAVRWNIDQEYDGSCAPGEAHAMSLPGDGITFQGSATTRVRIVLSEGTAGNSRYWCHIPLAPPTAGTAIDVPWDMFLEGCDRQAGPGPAYIGQPITTIQIEAAEDDFDMCVEAIRPYCPDGCSAN